MTNNLTNEQEFEPTPAMVIWVDTAVNILSTNISEISEQCKVSRQSWYEWQKSPEFISWYQTEWNKKLGKELWKLDVIGLKKAKNDFKFWDAMQKKLGGYNQVQEKDKPEPILVNIRSYLSEEESHDS